MAKTEKQGKCQHKWPQKHLNNSGDYFVQDKQLTRNFRTQTEAFAYAMPKGLLVYKRVGWDAELIHLIPTVEGKLKKEEKKKLIKQNDRFNYDWRK